MRISRRTEIPPFDATLSDEELKAEIQRLNRLWRARSKRMEELREERRQLLVAYCERIDELEKRARQEKGG